MTDFRPTLAQIIAAVLTPFPAPESRSLNEDCMNTSPGSAQPARDAGENSPNKSNDL